MVPFQAGYGICSQRSERCCRLALWKHRAPHESSLGLLCRLSYRFPGVSPAQFGGQEHIGEGRSTHQGPLGVTLQMGKREVDPESSMSWAL